MPLFLATSLSQPRYRVRLNGVVVFACQELQRFSQFLDGFLLVDDDGQLRHIVQLHHGGCVFCVVSASELYPGAAVRCICLPGELILDAVTDPLSLTVIDEKCLSVNITVSDAVVISVLFTFAVTLTFAFSDVIDDDNSDVVNVAVVVGYEHSDVIYLFVPVDYVNCDSVGVDEPVDVCDAVTITISVGV
jgi:hypothetical protein